MIFKTLRDISWLIVPNNGVNLFFHNLLRYKQLNSDYQTHFFHGFKMITEY